jgi:cytochrome c-type biogenesis protein CcmH
MKIIRALRSLISTRTMWMAIVIALIALLAIGANHPTKLTQSARISDLENIIKCPSCANASLAQSETVAAQDLKTTIGVWVRSGLTDQTIESRIVAEYGTGELLRPTNQALWIVPTVIVVIAVLSIMLFLARKRSVVVEADTQDRELVDALMHEREHGREEPVDER